MATMSSFPPGDRDKYIGMVEAMNGLGLLIGPLAGALLYQIGGFALPFIFFASLYLIFLPVIVCIMHSASEELKSQRSQTI